MQASNAPTPFPMAFGTNAGSAYIRSIPVSSQIGIQNGAASLNDGFPPDTFSAIASGGAYIWGEDLNGILFETTLAVQWLQVGYTPRFNSTFSGQIGGYPNGALLISAAGSNFWLCTTDNNTSDPDTGGAGWQAWFPGYTFQYDIPNWSPYNAAGYAGFGSSQIGDTVAALFSKSTTQTGFGSFRITNAVNLANPIKLLISYTNTVANGNCYLQLGYQVIGNGASLTPSYTTLNDTLPQPSTANHLAIYTTTVAVIPSSALSLNSLVNFILSRIGSNSADTNTGSLEIINIAAVQ